MKAVSVTSNVEVAVTGGGVKVETGVVFPLAKARPRTVVMFQEVGRTETLLARPYSVKQFSEVYVDGKLWPAANPATQRRTATTGAIIFSG